MPTRSASAPSRSRRAGSTHAAAAVDANDELRLDGRIGRDAVVCERELPQRLAQVERTVEVARGDPGTAVEQAELDEQRLQARRGMQHLASVLLIDRVHEPADELEPPRRRVRVEHVVDRVDGLHAQTLPTG